MNAGIFLRSIVHGVILTVILAASVQAMVIRIPSRLAAVGQQFSLPVIIDKADNLAGLKIVIEYDEKVIAYRKCEKSKQAQSLMHVVNDNKPGVLIIVMAGAKGLKGEKLTIVDLVFEGLAKGEANLKVTKSQLMSDQLKNMEHRQNVETIRIDTVVPSVQNKARQDGNS